MTRGLDAETERLARKFPGWQVWRAPAGLLYARPWDARGPVVVGESEADLARQITAEALPPGDGPG